MLLDEKEIEQLTGYKRYTCQIRWLQKNGINHRVGYDGKPKVSAAHFEEVMGNTTVHIKQKTEEPDIEAFRQHLGLA